MAVIEFARNVLGLEGANSAEFQAQTNHPVVDLLPEQQEVSQLGATMRLGAHPVLIETGTLAHQLYGADVVLERHRHRYEVNPDYVPQFESGGLAFSGRSEDGRRMEVLECRGHPYFVAAQFHPEFLSRPNRPRPLFTGLVQACLRLQEKS